MEESVIECLEARMATARQVAANRRNAKKSTGPRTEAGKAMSKANAIKHGLTGETVVLSDEDEAEFNQLAHHLRHELAPKGELEGAFVDRIVTCLWRLKRVGRIEADISEIGRLRDSVNRQELIAQALVDRERCGLPHFHGVSEETVEAWYEAFNRKLDYQESIGERPSTVGHAFLGSTAESDPLGKLYRYEVMIERSLHRALEQLERLQAKRRRLATENATIIDVDAESVNGESS